MTAKPPPVAALLLVSLVATCADPAPPPELSCTVPAGGDIQRGDSLVVTDLEAPCTVRFREVARLRASPDEPDPRVPVKTGPGGTYVTATYSGGEVAVWSERGEFVRTVGNGEGSGPGEFGSVSALLVDSDSVINILPGLPLWHRYTWSGGFLETVRVPTTAGIPDMAEAGRGTLVTSTTTPRGPPLIVWQRGADSVRMIQSPGTLGPEAIRFFEASGEAGLWSLLPQRYLLQHHDPESLGIKGQLVREADWFPVPPEDVQGVVSAFAVDRRKLLWTVVGHPAPDAPSAPRPPATSREEYFAIASRYRNTTIEVLTMDGRLLASRTYEQLDSRPRPATAERWYREETDPFPSIVILEPRLVQR